MPSAKDVTVSTERYKVFVCGDAGTGKSIFASTFPTPAFLFNFDKSILSYRGLDIDYEDYTQDGKGWVKFEKDFHELQKQFKEAKPYETIILDSTTTWTDLAMERALQLDPKRSPTGGPLWNVHFGMVKNLIEGRIRQLLELPCNIIVIGHNDMVYDEDGSLVAVKPMLTGQLSVKVPSYFDELYYSKVKMVKGVPSFVLQTIAKGLYKARSRLSGIQQLLPHEVPNNYQTVIDFINKGEN